PVAAGNPGYVHWQDLGTTPSKHVKQSWLGNNRTTVCFTVTHAVKSTTKPDSYSMIPVVNNISEVVYVPPTRENVHVGDIIIYRKTDGTNITVIHRVTKITS